MGMLYAQRATLDPDRAEPWAARAAELFERVERHADDVELVRAARMMRASVMSVQGDLDGCIALFESLKPDRTAANIDLMLASMYQQRGDLDAGLKLFQESMGWCVMNAISCVSAQIPLYADDAEHLEALLRAGEGVLSGFDLQNQSPMTVLTFCTNASSACLQAGDEDRAANYLERFTSLLEELDARMLVYGRNQSALYDRAPELWSVDPGQEHIAETRFGAIDFRRQCAQMVAAQPVWAERAGDSRFKPLFDRLEAL